MGRSRGLSNDVLHYCILPRLPTKALIRLTCVSRSWHSLISGDLYFIHLHSQRISSGVLYMERYDDEIDEFFPALVSQDPRSFGVPRSCFQIPVKYKRMLATCNGLVCLLASVGASTELYIGNPVLGDWRLLDRSLSYLNAFGLAVEVGKSAISYKLVMLEDTRTENTENENESYDHEVLFNVLSSKSGKWEVAKTKTNLYGENWIPMGQTINVSGVLYWIFSAHLLWFDTKDEHSGFCPLPPGSDKCGYGRVGQGIGELTYSRFSRGKIEIWSMDHSSWTKRHTISLKTVTEANPEVFESLCRVRPLRWEAVARYCFATITPMPFEGGAIVFFLMGGYLFSYNMETGEAEKRTTGVLTDVDFFSYKNCIVPLPSQL